MNFLDIALHGAVAAGSVLIFGLLRAPWWGVTIVSFGFLFREDYQGFLKHPAWIWFSPWGWSVQKLAEGFVPIAAAIVAALVWRRYGRQLGSKQSKPH